MDEFEFEGDVLKVSKRGKVQKKGLCHDCLDSFDPKSLFKVTRNNFGIPHIVCVCKKMHTSPCTGTQPSIIRDLITTKTGRKRRTLAPNSVTEESRHLFLSLFIYS